MHLDYVDVDYVFISSQDEVESVVSQLREHSSRSSKGMQLMALPMYGGLPFSEQVQIMCCVTHC